MKRCPTCTRNYFDDTLSYCLEDGSALVYGISSEQLTDDESDTAILSRSGAGNKSTLDPPPPRPGQTTDSRSASPVLVSEVLASPVKLILLAGLIASLLVGGFFAFRSLSGGKQINSIAV